MNNNTHIHSFDNFTWTDICKPDKSELKTIANQYNLDLFQLKDSLEHGHLPKLEKTPNYNFLILRAYTAHNDHSATTIPHLSNKIAFFYNKNEILTIHRGTFDFLLNFEKKFHSPEELLVYLIHKMLETYTVPLVELDLKIDIIEKSIFLNDGTAVSLQELYFLKTHTRNTKKLLQIFQNVIQQLEVTDTSKIALQDIKDRLLNLIHNYDEVLENGNSLLQTFLSINSQKSNNVMELLTIFSAFFLPLTFIVGIYGMNFENMPELKWANGYYIVMGVMVIVALIIFQWFKRKKII